VRVPYAHDEAAPPAAEPVAHDGDDGGPARGLEQARDHLGEDVEREGMQAEEVPGAEERHGGAAGDHAEGKEAAEVKAVAEVAGDEHAEGIGGEEGDVGGAEERRVGEGRPRPGELALDDAGRLAGGVVERVGQEGEPQDEGAVGVVGERGQGSEAARPTPTGEARRRLGRRNRRCRRLRHRGAVGVEVARAGGAMAGGAVGKAGRKGKREDVAGRRVEALDTRPSCLWARLHCLLIRKRTLCQFCLFVCFERYASFLRSIQYFISLIFFLRMTLGLAPVYLPFPEPSVCFVLACPYVDAAR